MDSSTEQNISSSHLVPIIDIAAFIANKRSPEAEAVINAVRQACLTSGFFAITGHCLPLNVQQGALRASQRFFSLGLEEKKKLDAALTTGRRGYDVLASQSYHTNAQPDLKEGFYIGHDVPLSDPKVRAGRFFMGPNVWPDESVLAGQDFRVPIEAYFHAVHSLALNVLELVACTLPYGSKVFDGFTVGHTVAVLRLLHYPPAIPQTSPGAPPQLGAGEHTDFGAITLLLQDEQAGLEVLDPASNMFVPVNPIQDALVVNVGDMLSVLTDGKYKSSVHRVINKAPVDRYSIAFFYDGALDYPLTPWHQNGQAPDGNDVLTVEKHLLRRIADSYGSVSKQ